MCVYVYRVFVQSKTRDEFRANQRLTDLSQLPSLLVLAHTHFDTLQTQITHMRDIMQRNMIVTRSGMSEWHKREEEQRRQEEKLRQDKQTHKRHKQALLSRSRLELHNTTQTTAAPAAASVSSSSSSALSSSSSSLPSTADVNASRSTRHSDISHPPSIRTDQG